MTGAEPSGFAARLEVRLASSNKRVKVVTYLISLLRTYQFDTRLAIQSGFNPVQNFRDNRELAERSIAAIAAGPLVSAHAGRSLSRGENAAPRRFGKRKARFTAVSAGRRSMMSAVATDATSVLNSLPRNCRRPSRTIVFTLMMKFLAP